MADIEAALQYARDHKDRHLEEFKELVSIPSISTLSEHADDIARCAEWLAEQLRAIRMTRVEIIPTAKHPTIYAEWLEAPGKPTVLVYGHYDVQPADPLNEWISPPFEPAIRDDYLHGRGASDMKGQIFAQLKAMECIVQDADPPVNIKYMLEGEEEIGSPNLEGFIDEHNEMLSCDFVLNCDAGILAKDKPAITYGLRGLAYYEVEIRAHKKDLHSGLFGGSVANPAHVLCELIAQMHDADGRVTLPGFYDQVRDLDEEEREALAALPHTDEEWLKMAGSKGLYGEKGFSTIERVGARPTLEVNGIWSGFTGEGSKTVLPAVATAKISARLVADQHPPDITEQLEAYFRDNTPDYVDWELRPMVHGVGAIMDRHSKYMEAATAALKETFGVEPVFRREGGSIPVVGILQEKLGVDSVMLGFAMPDDGIHGPNERQYLPNFFKGIETYIHFLSKLGK